MQFSRLAVCGKVGDIASYSSLPNDIKAYPANVKNYLMEL